jgi:Uma2 family endonuclease
MVEVKFGPRTVDLPYTLRLKGVTEEEFDELVDEDTKAELLDGVMIVHSPASPRHNSIAGFLRTLMGCYAKTKGLGKVFGPDDLVHLATCRKFAPDGFFLKAAHVPQPLPKKQFEGAPDLVIEILSSSNRADDLEDKRPAYQKAGVAEIWFVDPDENKVVIDRRQARRRRRYATSTVTTGRLTTPLLPGFWVESEWLWADPLPNEWECLHLMLD